MTIKDIQTKARETWGEKPMALTHIALVVEVVAGDICRQARNQVEGRPVDEAELKKELGNLIASCVRWCSELGFDPEECIQIAQEAQARYAQTYKP